MGQQKGVRPVFVPNGNRWECRIQVGQTLVKGWSHTSSKAEAFAQALRALSGVVERKDESWIREFF